MTLTLTLDRFILHIVVHHSSTSTYITNIIEIELTFCGRTDERTDRQTFETHFIRSTQKLNVKGCGTSSTAGLYTKTARYSFNARYSWIAQQLFLSSIKDTLSPSTTKHCLILFLHWPCSTAISPVSKTILANTVSPVIKSRHFSETDICQDTGVKRSLDI